MIWRWLKRRFGKPEIKYVDHNPGPEHPHRVWVCRSLPCELNQYFTTKYRLNRRELYSEIYGWDFTDCGVKAVFPIMVVHEDAPRDIHIAGYVSFETSNDALLWKLRNQCKD